MIGLDWATLAFAGMIAASLAMMLTENWRIFLACLALQYVAVFIAVSFQWSLGLAAVKLVVGLMSAAILGAAQPQKDLYYSFRSGNSGVLFRFLAVLVMWLLVFAFSGRIAEWLPVPSMLVFQGLLLAGMGLLQIALSNSRIRSIVGLLSIFSGFEIIYTTVRTSVLVTGLLAMINLSLALVGSYWMHFYSGEETDQ